MATVLVGVDYTSEGQAAVMAGIEEAARRDTEVLFLHYVRVSSDEQELPRQRRGEELLHQAEDAAERAGIVHRSLLELGVSSAGSQILRTAAAEDTEVIVVGTRRRSRVGKALMGSDAQEIILGASCPVLCVKAPGGSVPVRDRWDG